MINELLGSSDKQLDSAFDSTEEPTPNKKKKKRRNNRQNNLDAEKSAIGAKEAELTPVQLTEEAIDVIEKKNIIGQSEERKAHEPGEGASNEKMVKSESQVSKQPEIVVEETLEDEKTD